MCVYENIDGYSPSRKRTILILFGAMSADIMANKRFQAIIKELFIRCRKFNISLAFTTQSYFSVPKGEIKFNTSFDYDSRKCEYLTGEDLRCKPSVFEQAKFDFSPLGNIFAKGLD